MNLKIIMLRGEKPDKGCSGRVREGYYGERLQKAQGNFWGVMCILIILTVAIIHDIYIHVCVYMCVYLYIHMSKQIVYFKYVQFTIYQLYLIKVVL